jgi:hypothetical protein
VLDRGRMRAVNRQIYRLIERTTEPAEFMCECGGVYCTERIALTAAAFSKILTADDRYLVAAGHDGIGTDVVAYGSGYLIVVGSAEPA